MSRDVIRAAVTCWEQHGRGVNIPLIPIAVGRPMLQLLREASIDRALEHYDDPEAIPERNINFAREKGTVYMKMLRDSCF